MVPAGPDVTVDRCGVERLGAAEEDLDGLAGWRATPPTVTRVLPKSFDLSSWFIASSIIRIGADVGAA